MSAPILIRGGRLVDPAAALDRQSDLFIEGGFICPCPARTPPGCRVLDATGCAVVPGLVDMHVHFREPGDEEAETTASGALAAAAGGFVLVLAMPNTSPPVDTPEMVRQQLAGGRKDVDVLCAACLTQGRRGERVADIESLAAAGAAAFTDDGSNVDRAPVLAEAMRRAATLGKTVLDHALDPGLAGDGVMRSGPAAKAAGLPGIPAAAEVRAVERDVSLAEATGCAVHIQHLSTARGVELVAAARSRGLRVTAEATPHHLSLTELDVDPGNANFKMSPPLGTAEDREALRAAVASGVIGALATDHAPHAAHRKAVGFRSAPFGVVGLETAVGVTYTELVVSGILDLAGWVARWTTGPAGILGLRAPSLAIGERGRVAVLDLKTPWTVDPAFFLSRSRNTPFTGKRLLGRARWTICDGRIVWDASRAQPARADCAGD